MTNSNYTITAATCITLAEAGTKLWESVGQDGAAFGAEVRAEAEKMAQAEERDVTIYAAGPKGYVADIVSYEAPVSIDDAD